MVVWKMKMLGKHRKVRQVLKTMWNECTGDNNFVTTGDTQSNRVKTTWAGEKARWWRMCLTEEHRVLWSVLRGLRWQLNTKFKSLIHFYVFTQQKGIWQLCVKCWEYSPQQDQRDLFLMRHHPRWGAPLKGATMPSVIESCMTDLP